MSPLLPFRQKQGVKSPFHSKSTLWLKACYRLLAELLTLSLRFYLSHPAQPLLALFRQQSGRDGALGWLGFWPRQLVLRLQCLTQLLLFFHLLVLLGNIGQTNCLEAAALGHDAVVEPNAGVPPPNSCASKDVADS